MRVGQSCEGALSHFDADLCGTCLLHEILFFRVIILTTICNEGPTLTSVHPTILPFPPRLPQTLHNDTSSPYHSFFGGLGAGEAHFCGLGLGWVPHGHVLAVLLLVGAHLLVLHGLSGEVFLLQLFSQTVVVVLPLPVELIEIDLNRNKPTFC